LEKAQEEKETKEKKVGKRRRPKVGLGMSEFVGEKKKDYGTDVINIGKVGGGGRTIPRNYGKH